MLHHSGKTLLPEFELSYLDNIPTYINISLSYIRYLHARHSVREVRVLSDRVGILRRVEARPSGAGVELGLGVEEFGVATDAVVET